MKIKTNVADITREMWIVSQDSKQKILWFVIDMEDFSPFGFSSSLVNGILIPSFMQWNCKSVVLNLKVGFFSKGTAIS